MSNSLTMPFSAAIIAAVMFSSCLTTSSARADAAYLIKNLKSGRCLDARDPDPSVNNPLPNGTAIQLWDCWGGPMQQWTFPADGSIRNVKGGRCLDARDPDPHGSNPLPDGTAIQLWDCWGGPMQQWAGDPNRQSTIINSKGRRCLDARDPDPHGNSPLPDGTAIQLWDCWGGQMQVWYRNLVPLPVNCGPFQIGGLFLKRYMEGFYGQKLGCPNSPEGNHPDGGGGRYQTFVYGAMAYSPGTGPNSVQIGYSGAGGLGLNWSTTEPFTYNKFVVRYDRDGANVGQDDIGQQSIPNNAGSWAWGNVNGPLVPGLYRLVVEGCDVTWDGGNKCLQGFSLPVYVRVP